MASLYLCIKGHLESANCNLLSCNSLLQLTHWSGRSVKIELLERAIELDDEFALACFDGKPCPKSQYRSSLYRQESLCLGKSRG